MLPGQCEQCICPILKVCIEFPSKLRLSSLDVCPFRALRGFSFRRSSPSSCSITRSNDSLNLHHLSRADDFLYSPHFPSSLTGYGRKVDYFTASRKRNCPAFSRHFPCGFRKMRYTEFSRAVWCISRGDGFLRTIPSFLFQPFHKSQHTLSLRSDAPARFLSDAPAPDFRRSVCSSPPPLLWLLLLLFLFRTYN